MVDQLPPPVLSKKDFVRRYAKGEFGNASPTWQSYKHLRRDSGRGSILLCDSEQRWHIRNRIIGGKTWYDVEGINLYDAWLLACCEVGTINLYISAMAPTDKTLIQGEVQQTEEHLYLTYSRLALPMRKALAKGQSHLTGILAVETLRYFLCYNSFEWLQHLLNTYPLHVIEFSTYDVDWGTVPHYNTVFWEIRSY